MSRLKIGDNVRVWKLGHAEHGQKGIIDRIITIEEYGGPEYRGPHAYYPKNGWGFFGGPLPDAMVVSECCYQKCREDNEFSNNWPV